MKEFYKKISKEKRSFKLYTFVSIYIITISITLGALGSFWDNKILLKLHPYIFFIGFGNLSILILNRYLLSSIYPELQVSDKNNIFYIKSIILSISLVTIAIVFDIPIIKTLIAMILMFIILHSLYKIKKFLSFRDIWKNISARYYIFDIIFLLNAALGLFVLGIKETFPNFSLIPFFITESSYFLGSSFPLSISIMGFLYSYITISNSKSKLVRNFFNLWFYVFITGVLIFLVLILAELYWGMIIVSNLLILGVFIIFIVFIKYLLNFYKNNFKNPSLAFLLSGLILLLVTGVFGVMNINNLVGREFGTRLAPPDMWGYHSHTHAALLGWISLSFTGIMYSVYNVLKEKSQKEIKYSDYFNKALNEKQRKSSFIQLIFAVIFIFAILVGFYLDNRYLLLIFGLLLASSLNFSLYNLLLRKNK